MLSVSPAALSYLSELLANAGASEDEGIRLVTGGGNWDVHRDLPSPDDVVFSHEGRVVLLLSQKASKALGGTQLDLEEDTDTLTLNEESPTADG
jgi:hypothetical protein